MTTSLQIKKPDRPALAKHDSSILDLVFTIDSTSSMAPYIQSAKNNICSIITEIVANEKSDIRLALIEYRDHPPQDATFVTRVHDLTSNIDEMTSWLEDCNAEGGGDLPEAVADALAAVLKLSWRPESTKICILISDAPPHGLDQNGDTFPNGCPAGHDPARIVRDMAEKHITLYSVGAEPSIVPYRDFFMALAYITGGQYVPMVNAQLLAKVIVGGVREEISLDRLMRDALPDIDREMNNAEAEGADEKVKSKRLRDMFSSKNIRSKQMKNANGALTSTATDGYAKCPDMTEMRILFQQQSKATSTPYTHIETISETNYDLLEDEAISEDQAARIVQKWQGRQDRYYGFIPSSDK
ncbi:unnamed protein product [Rotaria socialis]|uniref:VWFA domain-containing protein n=1 Tax=Rotaria socialis TaxID=392032 RepID=A0A820UQ94_9BILA|nr:unnamed protein product [Rotaria socialis]CAF3528183.1 unnamed protein product [Rotaria socialis]CAF4488702.1 unnamed protein product [Rotaria socialis]CAF4752027.1 unnamed protein product [Rotaria socialis]